METDQGKCDPGTTQYSEDGWLKGYFYVLPEAEVQGGRRVAVGVWKNLGFPRLRDCAFHTFDPQPGKMILNVGCADGASMV